MADSERVAASGVRRILAVFGDGMVFFVLWSIAGVFLVYNSVFAALGAFLLVDVVATAFTGATPGRLITGIRVVRGDGHPPGLRAAAIRTGLVLFSGFVGLGAWVVRSLQGKTVGRMWWDSAAGTYIVSAARPRSAPGHSR